MYMLVTRLLAVGCFLGAAAFQMTASDCGTIPSGDVCIYGTVNGNPPGRGDTIVYLCYNNTTCTSGEVTYVMTDKNGHFKFLPGALGGNWTVRPQGATYMPQSYTYINPPANQEVSPDANFTLESGGGGCGCYDYCTPGCCGYNPVECCDEDPCNPNCADYPDECYGIKQKSASEPRMESLNQQKH